MEQLDLSTLEAEAVIIGGTSLLLAATEVIRKEKTRREELIEQQRATMRRSIGVTGTTIFTVDI